MDCGAVVLQLRYSAWATRRVLDSVRDLSPEEVGRNLGNSYGGVRGTLDHIYQADAIWFDRLMGAQPLHIERSSRSVDLGEPRR